MLHEVCAIADEQFCSNLVLVLVQFTRCVVNLVLVLVLVLILVTRCVVNLVLVLVTRSAIA